jgi:polyhydroxybutyrate depolymerase
MDMHAGRLVFLLGMLGLASLASAAPASESAGNGCKRAAIPESIVVNGVARTYLLYVPCSFEPWRSALIVGLHGRSGTGADFEAQSNLDATADREGFAIAYPDGLVDAVGTTNWYYFYDPFYINPPDDVGFVRALIDSLQAEIHPNARRIYVTGTSAGGFMAQTIGVELSERVAAIAVVQGGISVIFPASPQTIPNATAPISVLMLKGDQDPSNFYCGALFTQFNLVVASSDQDFSYWTGPAANRCSRVDTAPLCKSTGIVGPGGTVMGEPTSVVTKSASRCKGRTDVKLYRLIGGLDQWNQGPMNIPGQIPFNPDLNRHTGVTTNEIVWKFFAEHPKSDEPWDNR